jgi:1-acyl-sn-glycerol-3-phosphate acyltransferase
MNPLPGYRLIRSLVRFLLGLFYRRIDVVGIERIPASGPLIVVANHQNAMVDPMILLATVPRQLVPVAKAPLFGYPLLGRALRLVGAVPAYRRQEGGTDPARNEALFRAAADTLRNGGAILIFPEGMSQPQPMLMPLRTGAARMLLDAETTTGERLGVTLLPVGLVFHEPGTFRTGWAAVLVGEPVPTEDCVALYRTAPEGAVRRLTDRLAEALRHQVVEAGDRETLRLLRLVASIWTEDASTTPLRDRRTRAASLQDVARAYRYLATHEPARVTDLRRRVEEYARDLELAGVADRQLPHTYPAGVVLRYAIREGFSLLLGLPLALLGAAVHLPPYRLTRRVARWLRPPPDAEATCKLTTALVLYPFCWAIEGWMAWWLGGAWALAVFLALLLPTGFFAITWRDRSKRVQWELRGFLQFLVGPDLRHRLLTRRRVLADELAALARVVSASGRSAGPTKDA